MASLVFNICKVSAVGYIFMNTLILVSFTVDLGLFKIQDGVEAENPRKYSIVLLQYYTGWTY